MPTSRASFEHKAEVLRRYQGYAAWGGAIFGAAVSIIVIGPRISEWSNALMALAAIVAGSGGIGALIGYLFVSIIIGSQSAGPGGGAFGAGADGSSGAGSDGGDGGSE